MDTLGLDFSDNSLRETLRRVANVRQINVQWVKSSQ
jgi:ubiquinone/menaquinone biosynthesis C-methylase UbiE